MHNNSQNEHPSNSQLTSGPAQSSLVEAKSRPPRSSTPFTQLPNPLFLAIIDFNFIDIKTLLLVCKRFYDMISKDQTLTRQRGVARIVKEKLGVSLFNPKLTRLTITDGSLSSDEIKQLLQLLPKLKQFERITTPEEAPFKDLFQCATKKWSSFALTSINASFSLPELKKLPLKELVLSIGGMSVNELSPAVLDELELKKLSLKELVLSIGGMSVSELSPAVLDELVSALPQAPRDRLVLVNDSRLLDEEKLDEQKRSHFFTHVLERLAQAGNIIDRPLAISITGFISIRNMDLLIQFLQANPAIHKLHIAGKFFTDEKEDPKKLFAELKKTRLVTLNIETELSVDACRQLGENLPDSVENLYLPSGLETSHLEAFTAKLTEKNIKSLYLTGHRILDFSPLVKLLSKLPRCTTLNLTPAEDFREHAASMGGVLKGMSKVIDLLACSTSTLTTLKIWLVPAMSAILQQNSSLTDLLVDSGLDSMPPLSRSEESHKLLDAAINNFNLRSLALPYTRIGQWITNRNYAINEIKKILLDLESPHSKWRSISSIACNLNRVPELIKYALIWSQELVNTNPESQAYLQSHKTCKQFCADLQKRANTLRHQYDQAGVVSSSSPAQADNFGDKIIGVFHEQKQTVINNIQSHARALFDAGKYDEAAKAYTPAVQHWRERQPRAKMHLAISLYNLGSCYFKTGNYLEAEPHLQEAAELADSNSEAQDKAQQRLTVCQQMRVECHKYLKMLAVDKRLNSF